MDLNKLAELIAQVIDPTLQKSNESVMTMLIIILAISSLALVANIVLQLLLKRRDYKYLVKSKRAEKTISVFDDIYEAMDELSNQLVGYDPSDPQATQILLKRISVLRMKGSRNRLSLSKNARRIIDDYADYCSILPTDLRKRDVKREDTLLERFAVEYHRL